MKINRLPPQITAFLLAFILALPDPAWALRPLSVQENSAAAKGLSRSLVSAPSGLEEAPELEPVQDKGKLLVGTRERKLDQNGRVTMPAIWRALWQSGTVFLRMEQVGDAGYVGVYPGSIRESLPAEEQGNYTEVRVDTQSRIRLDKGFLDSIGGAPGSTVVLLGVKDHLEIWNKERWEKAQAELKERYPSDLLGGLEELELKEPRAPAVPAKTVARVAAVAQAIVDEMLAEEAGMQESRAVVLDGVSPLLKDPKFEALVTELQKSKTFQGRIVIWGDPPDQFLQLGLPIALDEPQLKDILTASLQVKKATFIGHPNNIPSITGVVFNAPPPSFVALLTGLGVPGDIANSLVTELNSGLEEAQHLGIQA